MRLAIAAIALLCAAVIATAQDKPEKIEVRPVVAATIHLHRASYMRELWVAIAPDNAATSSKLSAADLLAAMRAETSDTTAVAVIDAATPTDAVLTGDERTLMRQGAIRDALDELQRKLVFDRRVTRMVVLGVFESCPEALTLARGNETPISGLVLIDPPVADLPEVGRVAKRVAVDVLLHARSRSEHERERDELIKLLGTWGDSARVIDSSGRFDSLQQRVAEILRHTRGYMVSGAKDATELARKLAGFDVVFVGELHGNPAAHRVQLEMLRVLAAEKRPMALATEQFERDVQGVLDQYLAGKIDEAAFLKDSRPWPNYADYRPLVELCRERKLPVIAGNIPRRLASRVHKEGPQVMEQFSEDEKRWTARKINAGPGAYRDKFMKVMGASDGHNERLENMYAAQCIKDDTMAESVADWLRANKGGRVMHINGNFHSAGGLGAVERLKALMPELKIAVVTCTDRNDEESPSKDEWLIIVPASR